jgi:CHASE3 domain sensor protein
MAYRSKDAWNQVGERFASFGRHLSDRYRQTGSDDNANEAQHKLEEAARQIGNQLDRAFSAIDETLRDAEAKKDLKDAVGAIGTAVGATIDDAGTAIRRRTSSGEEWTPPDRPDED